MYTTRTIDSSRTLLMVGAMYDDYVIARDPRGVVERGAVLRVPRFMVETPTLCCAHCGRAAVLVQGREKAESVQCPDYARHMYEACYAKSHDAKLNRTTKRAAHKQAGHWLAIWKREVTERNKRPLHVPTAQLQAIAEGNR